MQDPPSASFFSSLAMQAVTSADLDAVLCDDGELRILFLWGHECPNCDIAKAQMLQAPTQFSWPGVHWLHDNVYDDRAMATRFGLHAVDAVRDGDFGMMTALRATDIVRVRLDDATRGVKRVPPELYAEFGVFFGT